MVAGEQPLGRAPTSSRQHCLGRELRSGDPTVSISNPGLAPATHTPYTLGSISSFVSWDSC